MTDIIKINSRLVVAIVIWIFIILLSVIFIPGLLSGERDLVDKGIAVLMLCLQLFTISILIQARNEEDEKLHEKLKYDYKKKALLNRADKFIIKANRLKERVEKMEK